MRQNETQSSPIIRFSGWKIRPQKKGNHHSELLHATKMCFYILHPPKKKSSQKKSKIKLIPKRHQNWPKVYLVYSQLMPPKKNIKEKANSSTAPQSTHSVLSKSSTSRSVSVASHPSRTAVVPTRRRRRWSLGDLGGSWEAPWAPEKKMRKLQLLMIPNNHVPVFLP